MNRFPQKIKAPPGQQQIVLKKTWKPKNKSAAFYSWSNDNLFSFTIVRHPFDRILSAYRYF